MAHFFETVSIVQSNYKSGFVLLVAQSNRGIATKKKLLPSYLANIPLGAMQLFQT